MESNEISCLTINITYFSLCLFSLYSTLLLTLPVFRCVWKYIWWFMHLNAHRIVRDSSPFFSDTVYKAVLAWNRKPSFEIRLCNIARVFRLLQMPSHASTERRRKPLGNINWDRWQGARGTLEQLLLWYYDQLIPLRREKATQITQIGVKPDTVWNSLSRLPILENNCIIR